MVDPATITDEDARASGVARADTVRRRLRADESLATYRVELSWAGPDPRVALRSDAELSDEDVAAIDVRLERLDRASSHGPWTMAVLDVIRRRPATRAADLAERGIRPGTGPVQDRRSQAQEPRADPQPGGRVRAVTARRGVPPPYVAALKIR